MQRWCFNAGGDADTNKSFGTDCVEGSTAMSFAFGTDCVERGDDDTNLLWDLCDV